MEIETKEISFAGRHTIRPRMPVGIVLIVLGLPLIIFGAYEILSVWGLQAAPLLSLITGDDAESGTAAPPSIPEGGDPNLNWPREVLKSRVLGVVLIAFGLGCLW